MTAGGEPRGPGGPTIADLVEVAPTETVVRLDGRPGRLAELVVTGDVEQALGAVLAAAAADRGAAFFLVGHFGSGKSHLLAALVELLGSPAAAPAGVDAWPAGVREHMAALRPMAVAAVPLVQHRATARLDDVALDAAWAAVRSPGAHAPERGTDRRADWEAVLDAVGADGRRGLLVVLDELSEFLRAKRGPDLHEELRFLQFLGEWARDRPVVVVAALQESIEEVANVSERELSRIRDRYGTLDLSMRHVEDLVRGRLVRVRPGAEAGIERATCELERALPGSGLSAGRLARCYPVHPATLTVLEGLRFLFSQQRGVVDFICRQLRGDPASGIRPWQERGALDLLPPDRVYDHFRARLHERIETRRLADTVVPYYERAVTEVFGDEGDRELALRAVKLLVLLTASPLERPRTAAELTHLLLARPSALDPAANAAYLERAILRPLVAQGAYVVTPRGTPATYTIELEADSAEVAEARMVAARAELAPGDRRVLATLIALGSSPALPLRLLGEVGTARRELLWQNTLRSLLVTYARLSELAGPYAVADVDALVAQARAMGAEGAVVVAEPELEDADPRQEARQMVTTSSRLAVWAPAPIRGPDADAVRELHVRGLVLDAALAEGRTEPGGLVDLLQRTADGDAARAREILHRAYFSGEVVVGSGARSVDLPTLAGLAFERLLVAVADPLLVSLHPRHGEVAPRGELVGERLLRQLVVDVLAQHRLGAAAVERGQLRPLISGYLVPLGLVRRRGDAYVVAPDPARSPAVAEVLRLVPGAAPVAATEVVSRLADGPLGLTEPECLLVLNACVQAGLLEAWRGKRQVQDAFLAVTAPDRFTAGELVEPGVRSALAGLGPIAGKGPFEPWNADLQRAVWERARAWLDLRRDDLAAVRHGVNTMGENPVLAAVSTTATLADVAIIEPVLEAGDGGLGPVAGLRGLVSAIGDADATMAAAHRLAAVARLLREDLTKVEQAAAYLTHGQLVVPDDEPRLVALGNEARRLLPDVLSLAAGDRAGDLFGVEREFRRAFVATYCAAHERFYAGDGPMQVEAVRASPPFRALAVLAGIGAVAVPDDLVKVERALGAAVPARCHRNLDLELAWKPLCTCGFTLGQEPPAVDGEALVALADRGVAEHLAELARPEHRSRLEQAVHDLEGLQREELAGELRLLLAATSDPGGADRVSLAHLAAGPVGRVVADVLAGSQLVVRRDLAALREDIIGRRYPKRRLLELLASWVDAGGDLAPSAVVEVVDGEDERREAGMAGRGAAADPGVAAGAPPAPVPTGSASSATVDFLARRFPRLASLVGGPRPGEAFWLAAWWAAQADGAEPPGWLPAGLVAERHLLAAAAEAACSDLGARTELVDLDSRVGYESLAGDQVAAALRLGERTGAEVAVVLARERLLRHPLRLAADELARRLSADWQLADRVPELDPARVAVGHALASEKELAVLEPVLGAARALARLERGLAGATCRDLVEDLYPASVAPVPELLSRAEVAAVAGGVVAPETLEGFRASARRMLATADAALRAHAGAGFPGCLRIWEVGDAVVAPLLRAGGRVAILVVDAMRVDVWASVRKSFAEALDPRVLRESWAAVPEPTRTAESMASLYSGQPVAAGSGPASPEALGMPFAHLGYESSVLVGADREGSAVALRQLWSDGPPISIAVATAVDAMVHRSSVDVAGFVDEAVAGLRRRVVPTLASLPGPVPLVVLADHGFKESPAWGRGRADRYCHGGVTLEECVVPVAVFSARDGG